MKHYLSVFALAAALALGLSACNKLDGALDSGSEAAPEIIALTPLTHTPAKGIVTGTAFPDSSAIVAGAWFNSDTGESVNHETYFTNYTFKKGQGSVDNAKWGPDKTAYWPVKGTLSMMAFRPDTIGVSRNGHIDNVSSTWTNYKTLKLTVTNLRDDQDILVGANHAAKKTDNGDKMTFKHISCLLEVRVKSSQNYIKKDSDPHKSGIEIVGVTIDDVYPSYGEVTIVRGDDNNDLTITTPGVNGDKVTRTVLNKAVATDTLFLTTTLRPLDGKTDKANGASGKEPGKRVIVPAQTPTTMTIYYKLFEGSSENGSPVLKCDNISLAVAQEEANNKWVAGKKYTYKVNVEANKITIAPEVADWDDQEVEVNVPSA